MKYQIRSSNKKLIEQYQNSSRNIHILTKNIDEQKQQDRVQKK